MISELSLDVLSIVLCFIQLVVKLINYCFYDIRLYLTSLIRIKYALRMQYARLMEGHNLVT